MSTDAKPFNPTYLTFALGALIAVLSGATSAAVSSAVTSRDVSALQVWQREVQVWIVAKDKELADVKQAAAVTSKAFEGFGKDLDRVQRGVDDIKAAMMGRPAVVAPASSRVPYP